MTLTLNLKIPGSHGSESSFVETMNFVEDGDRLTPLSPYEVWGGWAAAVGSASDFESARKADPSIDVLLSKLDRLEQARHSVEGLVSALTGCAFSREEVNKLNSTLLDGLLLAFQEDSKNSEYPDTDYTRDDIDPIYFSPQLIHSGRWNRVFLKLIEGPPSVTVTFDWLLQRAPRHFDDAQGIVLYQCIEKGRCDLIHLLLQRGADPNANHGYHFAHACSGGSLDIVRLMVRAGADLHQNNEAGLRYAARHGATHVVEYLLDSGADVDAFGGTSFCGGEDASALMAAAYAGQVAVIRLLCDRGCDLARDGEDALGFAITGRHSGAVDELLTRGVVLPPDALEFAFEGNTSAQVLDVLLRHGADAQTALRLTLDLGKLGLIPALLSYDVDVTVRHYLLLYWVLLTGDTVTSGAVVERCPAPDQLEFRQKVDATGWPGLMLMLRDRMAADELPDESAFEIAVESNAVSMVRALLATAFASHELDDLQVYVELAIERNCLDAVSALLDHGCNLVGLHQTIASRARHANSYDLLDMLLARGFSVQQHGRTVLDVALQHKQASIARLLIQHGADTTGISPDVLSELASDEAPKTVG